MAYPEDTYNLFAQQKAAGYPNSENMAQFGQETKKMAQKYAPTLMGQQPKTNEQVITDRALQQTQNFAAPSTYTPVQANQTYNGGANNPDGVLDWLASQVTTPQQEERLRKASVANQRILAVGDALRHIGNIFNTVNYAPAQKFNSPVQEEYDRYQKGKALRDAANMRYLNYQQQKAAQDARMRQAEAQLQRQRVMDEWTIKKTEQQIKSQQEKDKRMEEMTAAKIAYQQGLIDEKEFNRKVKEYYMRLGLTPTGGALGGSRGRSGGGSGRPTQWQTRYDDFDYANRNGIPVQEETTDLFGNKTTKRRDPNVVHAEVEAHKRKANGGTTGKGKRSSGIK